MKWLIAVLIVQSLVLSHFTEACSSNQPNSQPTPQDQGGSITDGGSGGFGGSGGSVSDNHQGSEFGGSGGSHRPEHGGGHGSGHRPDLADGHGRPNHGKIRKVRSPPARPNDDDKNHRWLAARFIRPLYDEAHDGFNAPRVSNPYTDPRLDYQPPRYNPPTMKGYPSRDKEDYYRGEQRQPLNSYGQGPEPRTGGMDPYAAHQAEIARLRYENEERMRRYEEEKAKYYGDKSH